MSSTDREALLMEERDRLRTELANACHINQELHRQLRGYRYWARTISACLPSIRGTADAHKKINLNSTYSGGAHRQADAADTKWIRGTWLSESANRAFLGEAEQLFESNKFQHALNVLTKLLVQPDLSIWIRIEAKLLLSVTLRTCENFTLALAHAEDALRLADLMQDPHLVAKSQFYRGVCLYLRQSYAEASWCLSFALNSKPLAQWVQPWKSMAEDRRLLFPARDPRRYVPREFEQIPSSSSSVRAP